MKRSAKADVEPIRQRTQYSCMAASMVMALRALGHNTNEDEVNYVMGATPAKGAAWEQALATAQHFGCRATLVCPSTVRQLKEWTDAGIPVMIAWNPEGRDWSHASVVFDVDEDLNVHVADPNIPDPDETVRVVPKGEFYTKWYEKWPKYLVRRPALAVEREITPGGRQVMARKAAPRQAIASKTSARPGPHWNPWPTKPSGLQDSIDYLQTLTKPVRGGRSILEDLYPEATPGDQAGVKALIKAFQKQDRRQAKRIADQLTKRFPTLVDNTMWAFILDGRKASQDRAVSANRVARRYEVKFMDDTLWAGRRLPTKTEISYAQDARWQDWDPRPLPDDLYRYFKKVPQAIEVKVTDLTPIRVREKGVANANRYMWLAYWGAMDPRKPISLKDNGNGTYTVLDGNSTFANAKMSGWRHLVGLVEE